MVNGPSHLAVNFGFGRDRLRFRPSSHTLAPFLKGWKFHQVRLFMVCLARSWVAKASFLIARRECSRSWTAGREVLEMMVGSALKVFKDAHKAYLGQQLERAIALKTAERDVLLMQISRDSYLQAFLDKATAIYQSQLADELVPSVVQVTDDRQSFTTMIMDKPSAWHKVHHCSVVQELLDLLLQVIWIQQVKAMAIQNKQTVKKKLKDQVDVEMGDVAPSGKTLEQLVAAAVKKATSTGKASKGKQPAKGGKAKGKDNKKSSKVSPQYHPYPISSHVTGPEKRREEESGQGCFKEIGLLQQEGEELQREREAEGLAGHPISVLAAHWRAIINDGTLKYKHPLSYPDWIIDEISNRWAVLIIVCTIVPAVLLEANRL